MTKKINKKVVKDLTEPIKELINFYELPEVQAFKREYKTPYKYIHNIDIPFRIYASDFSFGKKIQCWVSMCKRFKKIMKLQRTHGFFSLILKEFIFDEIVYTACNSNYFEKLITTPSQIAYQPLIFEYDNILSKKLMIWYSANSNPLEYKKDTERFVINPTVFKNIRVDEHWVWTNENKTFLSTLTRAKILVKKSLMFY